MIILSLHSALQDSGVALFEDYALLAAVQQERLTRRKGDGGLPRAALGELLETAAIPANRVDALVLSRGHYPSSYFCVSPSTMPIIGAKPFVDLAMTLASSTARHAAQVFDSRALLSDLGLSNAIPVFFSNHHRAHALSALFHTDWDGALIYTADGGGDNVHYSHHLLKDGQLTCLFGDDRWLRAKRRVDSLGLLYGFATEAVGFRVNRHEGKLTGLAGYGQPFLADALARHFVIDEAGLIDSDFSTVDAMRSCLLELVAGHRPEDVAASVQEVVERVILASVEHLLAQHGVRKLALAGGVFANVRLNRLLSEARGIDEIFIFPGMGDEGLPIGGAFDYLLTRDGLPVWLAERRRLDTVFWGRGFDDSIDSVLENASEVVRVAGDPAERAAALLAQGLVGAIYAGRMEFGPRALGNRSILASPADAAINQRLNERLNRSEFMPFAPCVLAEDAEAVFDITPATAYACRFMTVTTMVKSDWLARIPAVVHVDGTARPQIVDSSKQPLYADILGRFKAETGLPVLVNTSFNAHEEPIINRPDECLKALLDDRVDFVVTLKAVYRRC